MASLSHTDLPLLKMERAIILTSPRPVGVQPELWKLENRRFAKAWEDIVAGRDPTAMTAAEVTVLDNVKAYLNSLTLETNRTHQR
jgi:myo-inositol catabolism protein IolC